MLEIILVQGFCLLKIKTTQFPNGFHLKYNEVQLSPTSKLISSVMKTFESINKQKIIPFF